MNQENNQAEVEQPQPSKVESPVAETLGTKVKAAQVKLCASASSMIRKWSLNEAIAALSLAVSLASVGWWVSSTNGRLHRLEWTDEDLYKNISSLSLLVTEANTGLAAANGRHEALSATVAKQINQLQADSKAMQDEVLLLVQSEAHQQEIARLKKEDEETAARLLAEKPTGFAGMLASIKNKFK